MTSTNDGKNVKINQSSGSNSKSYYIELYKTLDSRLSGEGGLQERTQHLSEAWRRIYSLCKHSASSTHPHLLSWLQRHTARTILQTEWQKPESKPEHGKLNKAIEAYIAESQEAIAGRNGSGPSWESQLLQRAEWFKSVLTNPWGHPILRLLSNPTGEKPSDKEVIEWLKEERGVMFVTRLRQLATTKTCADIASALVAAVMDRVRATAANNEDETGVSDNKKEPTFGDILKTEAGFTVDVMELLTDLEFVLLFKGENRSRCIELAKQTPLRSGYQLVERLHSRLEMSPREKKLWKNAKEVATLIAQVVIARCMVVPVCSGVARTALYCCTRSLVRLLPAARLPPAASALAAPAATARHLHTLAAAVDAQCNNDMKPFVCELYVRAITTGMNELERLKLKTEKEAEARSAEQTLSSWFTQLGTLLSKSPRLSYECALTAFSVHPSPGMYERIVAAPTLPPLITSSENFEIAPEANSEFGSWATDSCTKTNFVKTSETLNIKKIQHNANVLSTAVLTEGEAIGLPAELCQDLAVLLSGPRHKTLSWDMNRDVLLENCKTYMDRTHGGTRALTTELKYLNLDPRSFQHLPEEEDDEDNIYYGIEKGYEHLVELQEAEQIWKNVFDDSEETEDAFSSCIFDEDPSPVRRKKKKSKKIRYILDPEVDPLSTFDEEQYKKKKERPHSKERCKEKLKSKIREPEQCNENHDQTKLILDKKELKKERKVRKKREKINEVHDPTIGPLSRLIGMKVARVDTLPIKIEKQSNLVNYDSQRKLSMTSLNSDGSDTNVVFDGLYSMEEFKSPEKNHQYQQTANKTPLLSEEYSKKVLSNDNILAQDTDTNNLTNIQSRINGSLENQDLTTTNAGHIVLDEKLCVIPDKQLKDVKQNVKKLIEFRKLKYNFDCEPKTVGQLHCSNEKACLDQNNIALHEKYTEKDVKTTLCPIPIKSSPHIITPPNGTMVYLNKRQSEQLSSLQYEARNQSICNNSIFVQGSPSEKIYHPVGKNYIGSIVTGLAQYSNSINEQKLKEKAESEPLLVLQTEPKNTCKISGTTSDKIVGEKQILTANVPSTNTNEVSRSETTCNFEEFLKELKETINAGAVKEKSETQDVFQTDTKPVKKSMVLTGNNLKIHSAFASQCAKPSSVQQKMVDAPNTFARLNYLHKNKRCDVRSKPATCQSKHASKQISSEYEPQAADFRLTKFDYLKNKGDLTISRIGNLPLTRNSKDDEIAGRKNVIKENPCMANIVQGNTNKTSNVKIKSQVSKVLPVQTNSDKKTCYLAENDQRDLLLLLRQQSWLKSGQQSARPELKFTNIAQVTSQVNKESSSGNIYHNLGSVDITKKVGNYEYIKEKSVETLATSNIPPISKTQEKSLTIKTPTTVKKDIHSLHSLIKVEKSSGKKSRDSKSESKTGKKPTSTQKLEADNTEKKAQDWESVMDALLKHKTPSRGPNALDIALNKDSFEKRLKDIDTSPQKDTQSKEKATIAAFNGDIKKEKEVTDVKSEKDIQSASNSYVEPITKSIQPSLSKCNKVIVVQKSNMNLPKPMPLDLPKKDVAFSVINNHDPFISGIPNSDYDLLEELMDDDLRQEIGELFSDEESFNSAALAVKREKESGFETMARTMVATRPLPKNYQGASRHARSQDKQNNFSISSNHINFSQPIKNLKTTVNPTAIHYTKIPLFTSQFNNESTSKTLLTNKCESYKTMLSPHTDVTKIVKKTVPQSTIQDHNLYKHNKKDCDGKVFSSSMESNILIGAVNQNTVPLQASCTISSTTTYNQNKVLDSRILGSSIPCKTAQELVFDTIPAVKVENTPKTSLCNVYQNTYITDKPSIALLHSTQNPIFTPTIVSCVTKEFVPQKEIQQRSNMSNSTSSGQLRISEEFQSTLQKNKLISSPILEHQMASNEGFKIKSEITVNENHEYIPSNSVIDYKNEKEFKMNSEFKNLSEVQNHKLSADNQCAKNVSSSKSGHIVESTINNRKSKEYDKLQEKRLAILSRKESHHSNTVPIPLPYTPLKEIELIPIAADEPCPDANVKINQRPLDDEKTKIAEEDLNLKHQSMPKNSCNEGNTVPTTLDLEIPKNYTHNYSSYKITRRRTHSRPMYNIKNKILAFNEKSKIQKKCKARAKLKNENKSINQCTNDAVYSNETSLVNCNQSKDDSYEKKVTTESKINVDCINKENTDHLEVNKADESKLENVVLTNNTIQSFDGEFFDIEEQLIRSVIPKTNNTISDVDEMKDEAMVNKSNSKNEEKENIVSESQNIKLGFNEKETYLKKDIVKELAVINDFKLNQDNIYDYQNQKETNQTGEQSKNKEKILNFKIVNTVNNMSTNTPINNVKQSIKTVFDKYHFVNKKINSHNNSNNFIDIDKVVFEEITPKKIKDPSKRTFRVKLPNGKQLKATVTGKNDLDINDLLSCPKLKSILLNTTCTTERCTLNIKKISSSSSCNSHNNDKTNIERKVTKHLQPMETINLVSDEEDDCGQHHQITSLGVDICAKHKNKLFANCSVSLIKYSVEQLFALAGNSRKDTETGNSNNVPCNENQYDNINLGVSANVSLSSYQSLTNLNPAEDYDTLKITDNDNSSLLENTDIEPNACYPTNLSPKLLTVSQSEDQCSEKVCKSEKIETNIPVAIKEWEQNTNIYDCCLKLERCDNLVKKYEKLRISKQECFVELVNCDRIFKDVDKKLSKNQEEHDNDKDTNNFVKTINNSVPEKDISYNCENEASVLNSQSVLTRSNSCSILNDFPVYNEIAESANKTEGISNNELKVKGCSNQQLPVYDSCEADRLVSLQTVKCMREEDNTFHLNCRKYDSIATDWESDTEYNTSDESNDSKEFYINCSSVINEKFNVPSLKTLVLKLIQSHALLDNLQPVACINEIVNRNSTLFLKRKLKASGHEPFSKISKIDKDPENDEKIVSSNDINNVDLDNEDTEIGSKIKCNPVKICIDYDNGVSNLNKNVCSTLKPSFNSISLLKNETISLKNNNDKELQENRDVQVEEHVGENNVLNLNKEAKARDVLKTRVEESKYTDNIKLSLTKPHSVSLDHDYGMTALKCMIMDTENNSIESDINSFKEDFVSSTQSAFAENIKKTDTLQNCDFVNNVENKEEESIYDILPNVTLIYKDDSEVVLKGVEYEDPIAGTCYMFPLETSIITDTIDDDIFFTDNIEIHDFISQPINNTFDDDNFSIIVPKKTYSKICKVNKKNNSEKIGKKGVKRKSNSSDCKISEKRYRKSKNIDCLNNNAKAKLDMGYSKEFQRLFNYYSTLKFSYSRSFHEEIIDVSSLIKSWPIQDNLLVPTDGEMDDIFKDNSEPCCFPDPTKQTLVEELCFDYTDIYSVSHETTETNFHMGFGEESGRVLQNLENKDDHPKFSAVTLPDVKLSQPFLLSEDYMDCENKYEISNLSDSTKDDQRNKLKHYINYIHLRDKVRSYFKKTSIELNYNWIKDNVKDNDLKWKFNGKYDSPINPLDFYIQDYIDPPPLETIVQVVQVGQLPVSAAAQNPVTCDPRVTQVSDASPPQCSLENNSNDDSQSAIKTEYTELTTADLTLPLVAEYQHHDNDSIIKVESEESSYLQNSENFIQFENEFVPKIEPKEETCDAEDDTNPNIENQDLQTVADKHLDESNYLYDASLNNVTPEPDTPATILLDSTNKPLDTCEKTDQIAHAMNAAGITPTAEIDSMTHPLDDILTEKVPEESIETAQCPANNYSKSSAINAVALQQALAQILPPPLNQTNSTEGIQQSQNASIPQQVLHIVQGKNASGNQITLIDNAQQSVINTTNNGTPVLHIVQNKNSTASTNSNGTPSPHTNSFSGLSLVDAGLQQGGNQLLHIVNTGNQKTNNNTNQLLKRVNLLTNLTNVQGSNEQKMLQFVCKSADGKSIQLNASHQRSMVLRLQPIETQNIQNTPPKNDDHSPTTATTAVSAKDATISQEIKSRSVYEENYAKFIQNTSNKQTSPEKGTSLPKFNQAFGKPVFQDGSQKQSEINGNNPHLSDVNSAADNSECETSDNAMSLDHIGQISSPPLLLRKSPHTSQTQPNLVQQIKQTITPMNIQTMHGGVIYTRQIPVNIGGGQTINLITVPSTELMDESNQKQSEVKYVNQGEIVEPSIIKIVPQAQSTVNSDMSHEEGTNGMTSENGQSSQPQPVLTQMRIKLPMLSKTPQMVSGARVVRPSFFQIQRNVIGGANQPVYQQLVLTAAPPLGQQTIRLPQTPLNRQVKVPAESSESQMSSSTLEQLREFDMVLEQVKERSTVQPGSTTNNKSKVQPPQTDSTDSASSSSTATEPTQVLYSIGGNQHFNVAYVNRKSTVTTPATSTFARSPDSSGITETPSSSTQTQLPQTATAVTTSNETPVQQSQPKPAKIGSRNRSRPKASSNPPNTLKLNNVPPKTSSQKPLEDEQTTQRILYILAEYKEQVENSPDKDKPAPRRRSNPPTTPGSSKRKKSSSSSRRPGARDVSPIHGDDTCRTMGSEDSSCGTSQGDCNENCLETHSPQDSPRKIVRKLTFDHETQPTQPRPQPHRNVIVADGQTITVARGTAGKPTTAVLMPANYILPVSMVKGGQQIAIVTNRGPKLLTVGNGEGGTTNALLLQRLIGPAGLKPVLARPGVRHVRLPTASLHNLQAFNLAAATNIQPPDSTASPAPTPTTPPDLIQTRINSSPWPERESQGLKPERSSSPDGSEPWNVPSSADAHDYTYEETVRTDNMDRTVLVVQKRDVSSHRQHRLTHVSAAALRHKYAILEHELRLQKSLSEECEDLGVDSPSASELFPEAELLFAGSPAHDHIQDQAQTLHHPHTPQPTILSQGGIPHPDMDDQIATDQLLQRNDIQDDNNDDLDVNLGLDDVGIVTVTENGATITLDQEEFARSHPNTTFHSEPSEDGEVQPFTISGIKGRHITSTIFHANRAPATVLMGPQTTVISQATHDNPTIHHNIKYSHIDNIISSPSTHNNINLSSVLVKDDGLTRFDSILTDSRELHLSNTASAIVHSSHNATQVIRRVCYDDDKRDPRFLMDEPDTLIAGDDAKMIAEDSRDATLESFVGDVDDDRSSPERHTELYWESNSTSERSESRRPLDFSSDSDKCCKSPSYDETNSTDSSGVGTHMRLDSVIKEARGLDRSGSADGSSADDTHPPLRTYPAKRLYHSTDAEMGRSLTGKTRAGERSPDSLEVRRRASGRGVVKRGCHCCNGSPLPSRSKKPRQRKPTMDFTH
ncbi:extracellular matrix-binding protein ebh-like isoform X2 [Battus philenor]|uniref:extracellular matrix-binding protein ebh-like isoform X2 n=1 Tax=Battus philenor TaxID=42288 RepID=UPI0035CEBA58